MNKIFNFRPLFKNCFVLYNLQTVRWVVRKKPFWHGIAKSKITKIKKKKILPENENVEYNRLLEEYGILIYSVYEFIKQGCGGSQTDFKKISQDSSEKSDLNLNEILEKKIEMSYLVNDKWNNEIAEKRKKKMEIDLNDKFEMVQKIINSHEETKKHLQLRIDEIVTQEIEKSKSYITFENLDEEIEKSIQNVKDYNFALDLQGKKFEGSKSFEKLKLHHTIKTDVDL